MNNQKRTNNLDDLVKSLPKELEPSRDLWSGIEQAIAKQPQEHQPEKLMGTNFYVTWGKAAAAILPIALVAGLVINNQMSSGTLQEAPWLTPLTASYDIQKTQLLKRVSGQPQITSNWQTTMADLEKAERSLKKALEYQPEDPALMKMLNNVYKQQLELISKSHKPKYQQI